MEIGAGKFRYGHTCFFDLVDIYKQIGEDWEYMGGDGAGGGDDRSDKNMLQIDKNIIRHFHVEKHKKCTMHKFVRNNPRPSLFLCCQFLQPSNILSFRDYLPQHGNNNSDRGIFVDGIDDKGGEHGQ